jgi:hypothetical protein
MSAEGCTAQHGQLNTLALAPMAALRPQDLYRDEGLPDFLLPPSFVD